MNTVKTGWKTTEFWTTTIVSLVAILNSAFSWNIPTETVVTVAGVAASYILSRGITKKP